ITRVCERLDEWGCRLSRLRRKMYDFDAQRCGLENVMTPRETAALLLRLLRGECADRATSDAVLALLELNQDDSMLRRHLPPGVRLAHKTGTLEGVRNDAGIVTVERPVVVAAFLRELVDVAQGHALLGLLGWCAHRAAGAAAAPLPSERWVEA
ncbi:MAG: serine hydrolase, partial [Thermoleophilaceae bacterium]